MYNRIEQLVLRVVYAFATWARRIVWRIQRPTLVGVRVLVVDHDRVLLVRHRSGRAPWSLPGGGVKRYERLNEAAQREAREETGTDIRVERLLGTYDNFHSGTSNYVAVFVATALSEPRIKHSLEIAEARFFNINALPDGVESGSRERIAEWQRGETAVSQLWYNDGR